MSTHIFWNNLVVPITPNDTVASALIYAGIREFSKHNSGATGAVFCGIGQCQGCLVKNERDQWVEACLTPCEPNARFRSASPDESPHD